MSVKLVCEAGKADGELIAAVIAEAMEDSTAVTLTEARLGWRVEAYFEHDPGEALAEVLSAALGREPPPFRREAVPEADWVAISQKGLPPVSAGRFLVHGSHSRDVARAKPFAIEIDAGRAFGTAHHGTTKGCLLAIDALAKRRRFRRVLDMGTGSGVLAIAAAKSFGARVQAADIDSVAVTVARGNIRLNGAAGRVTALRASRLDHPRLKAATFDLILANILAGPLISFARHFRAALAPGGVLVLSGLLETQEAQVWGRYRTVGFALVERRHLEGWSTLTLMRR